MKHPELDNKALEIASNACKAINEAAYTTKCSTMPYKAQYILEEVIKILQEQV